MAEDHSSTSDPAVTERPSAAAWLIIMVGPDPAGGRETESGPPGGQTEPAGEDQGLTGDAGRL